MRKECLELSFEEHRYIQIKEENHTDIEEQHEARKQAIMFKMLRGFQFWCHSTVRYCLENKLRIY